MVVSSDITILLTLSSNVVYASLVDRRLDLKRIFDVFDCMCVNDFVSVRVCVYISYMDIN